MGLVRRVQPCSGGHHARPVDHLICDSDRWRDFANWDVVGKYDNLTTRGESFGEFPNGIFFVLAVQVKNQSPIMRMLEL